MKSNYIHILCFCVFTCFACEERNMLNSDIQIIDVSICENTDVNSIFSDVHLIPLETNRNSLVGLNIRKAEIYNGRIYLFNQMSSHSNILCFDLNGSFQFKIDRIGQGNGEYTYLSDFIIDVALEEIVLFTPGRIICFDLNGNYLCEKKTKEIVPVSRALHLNDSTFLIYDNNAFLPEENTLFYLDSRSLTVRDRSKNMTNFFYETGSSSLSLFKDNLLFYNGNDTIYDVKYNKSKYYVNFGKDQRKSKSIIGAGYEEESDNQQIIAMSLFKKGLFNIVSSFGENEMYVYVNFLKQDGLNKHDMFPVKEFVLYNKQNRKTYLSSKMIFNNLKLSSIQNLELIGSTEKLLIGLIDGFFTEEELMKITKSDHPDKSKILTHKLENNPILVVFKNRLQ